MFSGTLIRSGNNAKTIKGDKLSNFETAIMYLAPSTQSLMGNVCPMAVMARCEKPCLFTAGRGQMSNVARARIAKTQRYFANREAFLVDLVSDLDAFERYCARRGKKPACRLNGTSDIQWEIGHPVTRKGKAFPSIFAAFPNVRFYDYTKVSKRVRRELPQNYHLTLSYSAANVAYAEMIETAAHDTGANLAVVFRTKALRDSMLATGFMGRQVIDGDRTDMRFADAHGVVVGLFAKGKGKTDTSGFVVD